MAQGIPTGGSSRNPGLEDIDFLASSLMPKQTEIIKFFAAVVVIFLSWLSITIEVFFRYQFGERYLSFLRLFLAYSTMGLLVFYFPIFFGFGSLTGWFILAFLVLSAYHWLTIWVRNRSRIPWYSLSFGISRLEGLPLGIFGGDWMLCCVTEPVFALIVAVLMRFLDPGLGSFLLLAAFALFLKNLLMYQQYHNTFLDLADARIVAEHFNDVLQGKPKTVTAGIPPVSSAVRNAFQTSVAASPAEAGESEPSMPDFQATMAEVLREVRRNVPQSQDDDNPSVASNDGDS